ncbi:transglutaminase domain protein [Chthoniobacter flavus Ellin428]|uniref:Transglutaminase domain protein n=1 Tax=Chthoniobacter flavus Ellin428 TaxID=497964 RepID=B4D953_9BACT|nr:transglutaminase family protein [Chthoniobacter flavus]EDY17098.1 transglutaminase domain protein [Chthoniobacter flavus Ellin428]TCO86136.1 transglutaminase-like putative cysteine protease [Chthoniobacter flavus]
MEFEITHVTHYKYGHPAAEAYGEARLTPLTLPSQTVLSHRLVIDPDVPVSGYTDHFGNHVHFFSLPFRHKTLYVSNQAVVRTHPVPLPTASLELPVQEARQILGSVMTDIFDYLQMTPAVQPTRESVQWAKKYLPSRAPLGESLQRLNEAIHAEFKYNPGATENSTPLATIWKNKEGVCQDFAHVGLSILRTAGLPARYVCGYIETDPVRAPDGTARRMTGAVATHAWIEVLVPGMTWVAIDPTNRQWINERYVAVSFGRDQRDATPLRGTFKGSGGQNMKVRVMMKRRGAKMEKARI